ncbi:branched-chain amino acid transporter [Salipaludibacillus neizhouensis]|uniref:Branched-chain amino acid transporter n=1 Tax=Salipaludibacillus neizhouensis TaxID=885475 RepID=A0A3A9JZP1_9BACI|nr:AzlD domain-containing protein [Salipaludibacillus neizhouensis]RKL66364.1 branched-chain amino acid transporter [Salipaludibacillus neizhouensis]
MSEMILLVLAMGLVTYLPRMLPMVFLKNMKLASPVKRFLEFVPYAVLASLIFPGILYSVENVPSAIIGASTSIVLAFFRFNLVLIVMGGIAGVWITDMIFF